MPVLPAIGKRKGRLAFALLSLSFLHSAVALPPLDEAALRGGYPVPPSGEARFVTRFGLEFESTLAGGQFVPAPAPGIRCVAGAAARFYDSWFTLPDEANVRFIDIFGFDGSASEDLYFVAMKVCQPLDAPGNSINTPLGTVASAGASGDFVRTIDLSASDNVLDAFHCKLLVRFRFAAEGSPCPADIMAVDKVRIQYRIDP